MNLEQQVTSLETSRRLNELGVKQDSLWYHTYYEELDDTFIELGKNHSDVVSAFTVAELGELLPKRNKRWDIEGKWSNDWWFRIDQAWGDWYVNYHGDHNYVHLLDEPIRDKNIAEAMGKMLIYLLENGLMKLHD